MICCWCRAFDNFASKGMALEKAVEQAALTRLASGVDDNTRRRSRFHSDGDEYRNGCRSSTTTRDRRDRRRHQCDGDVAAGAASALHGVPKSELQSSNTRSVIRLARQSAGQSTVNYPRKRNHKATESYRCRCSLMLYLHGETAMRLVFEMILALVLVSLASPAAAGS